MSLDRIELRLSRANKHLKELEATLAQYGEDANTVTSHVEQGGCVQVGRLGELIEPDPEWSVLIGECLYNMRSALDHAVHLIALRTGQPLNSEQRRNLAYPIFTERKDFFWALHKGLQVLPFDVLALLERRQPYLHGDTAEYQSLAKLKKLNDLDKHRHLHTCAVGLRGVGWWGDPEFWIRSPPLKAHADIVRLTYPAPVGDVDMKHAITLHAALDETYPGTAVEALLSTMFKVCREVVDELAPYI